MMLNMQPNSFIPQKRVDFGKFREKVQQMKWKLKYIPAVRVAEMNPDRQSYLDIIFLNVF